MKTVVSIRSYVGDNVEDETIEYDGKVIVQIHADGRGRIVAASESRLYARVARIVRTEQP